MMPCPAVEKVTWVTKFLLFAAVIMAGTAALANNLPKSAKSSDPSRDLHFRQSSGLFKLVRGRSGRAEARELCGRAGTEYLA